MQKWKLNLKGYNYIQCHVGFYTYSYSTVSVFILIRNGSDLESFYKNSIMQDVYIALSPLPSPRPPPMPKINNTMYCGNHIKIHNWHVGISKILTAGCISFNRKCNFDQQHFHFTFLHLFGKFIKTRYLNVICHINRNKMYLHILSHSKGLSWNLLCPTSTITSHTELPSRNMRLVYISKKTYYMSCIMIQYQPPTQALQPVVTPGCDCPLVTWSGGVRMAEGLPKFGGRQQAVSLTLQEVSGVKEHYTLLGACKSGSGRCLTENLGRLKPHSLSLHWRVLEHGHNM